MAQKSPENDKPKVVHTTQTLHFQVQSHSQFHNDFAIPDEEFFTPAFIEAATAGRHTTTQTLFAGNFLSLDQLIQEQTTFADFESFKVAAFAEYLQQKFTENK